MVDFGRDGVIYLGGEVQFRIGSQKVGVDSYGPYAILGAIFASCDGDGDLIAICVVGPITHLMFFILLVLYGTYFFNGLGDVTGDLALGK